MPLPSGLKLFAMKKDIVIPEVENVFLAAIPEWSDDFMETVWNVYIINARKEPLSNVMVVSQAFGTIDGEMRKTSLLRHGYIEILPDTAVKVEMIESSVLALNNEFMVTFFVGNTLYDRKYIFRANSLIKDAVSELPAIDREGILAR